MAFKPIFVGINKQLDPIIDELTGAVRDAKALNALFMDSVPELPALQDAYRSSDGSAGSEA